MFRLLTVAAMTALCASFAMAQEKKERDGPEAAHGGPPVVAQCQRLRSVPYPILPDRLAEGFIKGRAAAHGSLGN